MIRKYYKCYAVIVNIEDASNHEIGKEIILILTNNNLNT